MFADGGKRERAEQPCLLEVSIVSQLKNQKILWFVIITGMQQMLVWVFKLPCACVAVEATTNSHVRGGW